MWKLTLPKEYRFEERSKFISVLLSVIKYFFMIFGVNLVLFWCYFGVILVLFWCYFDVILALFWCYFGNNVSILIPLTQCHKTFDKFPKYFLVVEHQKRKI